MRNLGCWKMTLLATILAAPLVAGCGKTIGETIDDTTITTRVKTAMLNDPAVGGLSIDVDTYKGVVTLSGWDRVIETRLVDVMSGWLMDLTTRF